MSLCITIKGIIVIYLAMRSGSLQEAAFLSFGAAPQQTSGQIHPSPTEEPQEPPASMALCLPRSAIPPARDRAVPNNCNVCCSIRAICSYKYPPNVPGIKSASWHNHCEGFIQINHVPYLWDSESPSHNGKFLEKRLSSQAVTYSCTFQQF